MKKSAKPRKRATTETAGIVVYIPTIKLLHDEVLIRLQHPERTSHGLWIPDSAKRAAGELWRGTVIAVGPGARTKKKGLLIKPDVEPGDIVSFFWRAGVVDVTKWPDDEHRLIHESDIQLVLGKEAA